MDRVRIRLLRSHCGGQTADPIIDQVTGANETIDANNLDDSLPEVEVLHLLVKEAREVVRQSRRPVCGWIRWAKAVFSEGSLIENRGTIGNRHPRQLITASLLCFVFNVFLPHDRIFGTQHGYYCLQLLYSLEWIHLRRVYPVEYNYLPYFNAP